MCKGKRRQKAISHQFSHAIGELSDAEIISVLPSITEIARAFTLPPDFLCQGHISVHHRRIPKCCLRSPSWSKGSVDVKKLSFSFCSHQVVSPSHAIFCHFTSAVLLHPDEGGLSRLPFIFPKMSLFSLIFLLISSIWFSSDPEQLSKVCVYIPLPVSSLLRCLSAEYLLSMIFIWIHLIFNLTSGLHDRAPLSASCCLGAPSVHRAIHS